MPRYIINLRDEEHNQDNFMEWSTIVDAPVTDGMTLDEFKEYYQNEYGKNGLENLNARLERVFEKGTSSYDDKSAEDIYEWNVAGSHVKGYEKKVSDNPDDNEWCMTKEELLNEFCRPFYKDRI